MKFLSMNSTERTTIIPATSPIITALNGETTAQPAVTPTRPARAPLRVILVSGLPNKNHTVNIEETAPAAPERVVVTAISPMDESEPERVLPALNPNHPNQRINTPSATKGRLCPGRAFVIVFLPLLCIFPFLLRE